MENSKPNRSKKVSERRLKVHNKGYYRMAPGLYVRKRVVEFPEIRIQGKWVQDCGFSIGDSVDISAKKGVIVIRKAEKA